MGTTGPANLDDRIRPNSETKSERVIHRRARAQCYARGGAARGRCQRKANFRGARTGFPSVGSGGLPSGTCASRWICASTSARTIMAAEAGGSRPRRGREPRDRSKDATGTRPSVPCSRGRSGVEFYNTARPHSALGYRPPAPEVVMPPLPVSLPRPGPAGAAQPSLTGPDPANWCGRIASAGRLRGRRAAGMWRNGFPALVAALPAPAGSAGAFAARKRDAARGLAARPRGVGPHFSASRCIAVPSFAPALAAAVLRRLLAEGERTREPARTAPDGLPAGSVGPAGIVPAPPPRTGPCRDSWRLSSGPERVARRHHALGANPSQAGPAFDLAPELP